METIAVQKDAPEGWKPAWMTQKTPVGSIGPTARSWRHWEKASKARARDARETAKERAPENPMETADGAGCTATSQMSADRRRSG